MIGRCGPPGRRLRGCGSLDEETPSPRAGSWASGLLDLCLPVYTISIEEIYSKRVCKRREGKDLVSEEIRTRC